MRRWLAGVFFTLCSIALLGGFLFFVFWWPRATPMVCLYVTGYEAPLPPQAFAAEDVQRFTDLFGSTGWSDGPITTGNDRAIEPLRVTKGEELLAALMDRVQAARPGGPNKDVVLIYVSAQGAVDKEDRPCLLAAATQAIEKGREQAPSPGDILGADRLLPIETLLARIKTLHPGAWKVLLLDAVRSDRNWRLGIAENLFADKLPGVMEKLAPADRVVLINSCSVGEVGTADPVHERTLFGEFVARGLWGEADTRRDGQIKVAELSDYLGKLVKATAQRRGRLQQPQLLWPGKEQPKNNPPDIVLARAQADACPPRRPGRSVRERLVKSAARWNLLPAMRQGQPGVGASALLQVEQARQELLRFESLLSAGKAYDDLTKTEPTLSRNWDAPAFAQPPPVSLPLSLPAAPGALAAAEQAARSWAASFAPVPKDQPDPVQKLADHQRLFGLWTALHDLDHPTPAEQLLERGKLTEIDVLPVELRTWLRFSQANAYLAPSIKEDASATAAFVQCRQRAEQAAYAGGDPRVYDWVAPLVQQADDLRREAEDLAFAGGDKAQAISLVTEAGKGYEEAQVRATEVAVAFALRDRALAELPYWLEWTCVGKPARVQLGKDLIGQLAVLEAALLENEDAPAAYAPLMSAKDILASTLQSLDDALNGMTDNCVGRSVHLGYLVELEQLLAGPLVSGADRARLWEAYFDVLAREQKDAAAATGDGVVAVPARGAAGELLKQWLNAQGERQEFVARMQAARAEFTKQGEDFPGQGTELRKALRQADSTVRGLSPWTSLAGVRRLGARHGATLRNECARHDFYCWQARRFLEDFQSSGEDLAGPQGELSLAALAGINPAGDPYFAATASRLLDAADKLFPRQDPAATRDLLNSRLAASRQLTRHVNQPLRSASSETVPSDSTTVMLPIQPVEAAAIDALPPGLAALRAGGADLAVNDGGLTVAVHADQGAPAVENSPLPIPGRWAKRMPPTVLPPQFTLARREEPWKFDFYYRGHVGGMSYEFAPLQPGHVIASRRSGDTGQVMIASHRTKGSVVIVLDCSNSMLGKRFTDAQQAVEVTIADLLRSEGMYVSLIAFGHRRSINSETTRNAAGRLPLKWNNLFGPDNPAITLTNDYDEVWNSTQGMPNLEAVRKLQPMGATPLYDTIAYAVANGFPAGSKAKHMIVLTDGRDSGPSSSDDPNDEGDPSLATRYDPPWDGLYNRRDKREARQKAAAKAVKDARLDSMLLFDLTATAELKEAATALGAELIPIESTSVLSDKILESIGIFDYRIAERGQARKEATTAKSEMITLPLAQYTLEPAGVPSAKVPFEIRGDEALSVRIDRANRAPRISFLDFDEAARADLKSNLRLAREEAERLAGDPLFPAEYHVSCVADRYVVGKKNRQFEVALRSVEPGRFTPRPREVWVEIVPARQSGTDPAAPLPQREPYLFINPSFKAGTPVPVLALDAPNWPADANTALVSVWLRMSESTAGASLTEEGGLQPASLARKLGIKFDWRIIPLPDSAGWAIRVSEQHTSAGPDGQSWCYVELDRSRADSVTRRFYPANGLVEHDFEFAGVARETLNRRAILIVPPADWKKTAAMAGPLTVSVPLQ